VALCGLALSLLAARSTACRGNGAGTAAAPTPSHLTPARQVGRFPTPLMTIPPRNRPWPTGVPTPNMSRVTLVPTEPG